MDMVGHQRRVLMVSPELKILFAQVLIMAVLMRDGAHLRNFSVAGKRMPRPQQHRQ